MHAVEQTTDLLLAIMAVTVVKLVLVVLLLHECLLPLLTRGLLRGTFTFWLLLLLLVCIMTTRVWLCGCMLVRCTHPLLQLPGDYCCPLHNR